MRCAESPTFVFVHGFLGFHKLRLAVFAIDYFRRLEDELRHDEVPFIIPTLPPAGSIEGRARVLAAELARHAGDRLVLIGHSMGGLDSRYLIECLDPARRVQRLVTLGTPHRGSALARWLLSGNGWVQRLAHRRWRQTLAELTPEACQVFNQQVPDRADVQYLSYAGARPATEMPFWLRYGARQVANEEGDNDGLVSVASASWGRFCGTVRADHFELVGWSLGMADRKTSRPFPHLDLYRRIITEAQADRQTHPLISPEVPRW